MTFILYFFAKAYEKADRIDFGFVPPYGEANVDLKDLQDSYLPIHLAFFGASRSLEFTEKSIDKVLAEKDVAPKGGGFSKV